MKKLSKEIRKNGIDYVLVERTETKAIYKSNEDFYEVFKIRIRKDCEIFGKSYPDMELYPNNEDFGKTAWCYSGYKNALKRYNKLL